MIDVATSHHRKSFGQAKGGQLRVQGPVSALKFDVLSWEELQNRGVSFLWIAKGDSDTFWDDAASKTTAKKGQCFTLIIQTHHIPGGMGSDYCGLVLQPTGVKRGQFRRLGVVLHETMWRVTDVNTFLQNTKNLERRGCLL